MRYIKGMTLFISTGSLLLLQACSFFSHSGDGMQAGYGEDGYMDGALQRGGRGYYSAPVRVPESYHFAEGASPTQHKARDKQWISTQDPTHYTIEMGTSEKASSIAKRLYQSPKNNRAAQFKHQDGDKAVYTGVYGSFKTKEEAQKVIDSLPESARAKAKVTSWQKVQAIKPVEPTTPTINRPEMPME